MDPPTATLSRIAVDDLAVRINDEFHWLYTTIVIETKLLLDVEIFERHGTDAATAFLYFLDR